MNRQQLKDILIRAGMKEQLQPDGTIDLDPCVYEALVSVMTVVRDECAKVADARRPVLLEQAGHLVWDSPGAQMLRAASREARTIADAIRKGFDAQQVLAAVPTPKWSNR